VYPAALVEENKWRAVRYGLDGKLIDFGKSKELPARDLIRELLEWFIGDVLDELGSRKEVEYAFRIMEEGTSADRQLATWKRTGDLKAVVDQLIRETAEGVA
jgi:carboxylate-amine ligase